MLNVIWPPYLLVNKRDQAEHTAHQYCSPQLICTYMLIWILVMSGPEGLLQTKLDSETKNPIQFAKIGYAKALFDFIVYFWEWVISSM